VYETNTHGLIWFGEAAGDRLVNECQNIWWQAPFFRSHQ
jgi:hypothetical protein